MKAHLRNLKQWLKMHIGRWWFAALIGGLIGGVFFASYYDIHIINVTNIEWLQNREDLEQHYAGWAMYRNSPWQFPLGIAGDIAYPEGLAVTYTDSIPLLAIPFKLLSPILPEQFQYLGLWGLICFILQGVFGALIVRRALNRPVAIVFGALLFILSPVLLARMFAHTALASTWLILAAITLVLYRTILEVRLKRLAIILWSLLLMAMVLIHPYYIPMVGAFFATYIVLTHRLWKRTITMALVPTTLMLLTFWLAGGFSLGGKSGSGDLAVYGFNLVSPFSSGGWSNFVVNQSGVSGESMNFLGLGVIILCIVALYAGLASGSIKKSLLSIYKKPRWILVVGIFLLLFIAACGTVVRFGPNVVADIQGIVPGFIIRRWAIFRSSARLFWPITYALIVGLLILLGKANGKKREWLVITTIVVCTVIQAVDILESPNGISSRVVKDNTPGQLIKEEAQINTYISQLSTGHRKQHLIYLGNDNIKVKAFFFTFDSAVISNDLTVNNGYFARSPEEKIHSLVDSVEASMNAGEKLANDTIYVTDDTTLINTARVSGKYTLTKVGGYVFIENHS